MVILAKSYIEFKTIHLEVHYTMFKNKIRIQLEMYITQYSGRFQKYSEEYNARYVIRLPNNTLGRQLHSNEHFNKIK